LHYPEKIMKKRALLSPLCLNLSFAFAFAFAFVFAFAFSSNLMAAERQAKFAVTQQQMQSLGITTQALLPMVSLSSFLPGWDARRASSLSGSHSFLLERPPRLVPQA
jgi:hypothetical protein